MTVKKIINGVVLFLDVLIFVSISNPSFAYTRAYNGSAAEYWPDSSIPVGYYVNLSIGSYSTSDQISVAQQAADAWGADSTFSYSYLGTTTDTTYVTANSINSIMSLSDGAPMVDPKNWTGTDPSTRGV